MSDSRDIDDVIAAARNAFEAWAAQPFSRRVEAIHALAAQYRLCADDLANVISQETLKPRWEARTEVESMIAKAAISIEAHHQRCATTERDVAGAKALAQFRPHGVVAVLGPFNMPGHLPNGHLMPALLAGNTVVFKPSELTPLTGRRMAQAWEKVAAALELPAGVFNLIQGGRDTGAALAVHPGIDGLFFTGSAAGGISLRRALADHPEKILALEMGGNNPLVVHDVGDLRAAAYLTIQSAFVTAGQRCSCARRLILCDGPAANAFVQQLTEMMGRIRVGLPADDPEPFMGPVISPAAAQRLLDAQAALIARGAKALIEMKPSPRSGKLLSPGLLDVSAVANREDAELFGPLLQLRRVPDFDAALTEANATSYGLSAGLISDSSELYERFTARIRAGVIAWNRPMTGASSHLPFGGIGLSGNHRPSAYFAADYCSYPVAAIQSEHPALPAHAIPGLPL